MISTKELLEYKELLQGALEQKNSMSKVSSLMTLKEIMFEDQNTKLINLGVSPNWVLWWWHSAKKVHEKEDWKEDPFFSYNIFDGAGDVEIIQLRSINGVGSWIDYKEQTAPWSLDQNIGPGSEWYDTKYPGEVTVLNIKYPLQPDEYKPEVTPLDVMFCELLATWDKLAVRYSRKAAVEGFVKRPSEAMPSSALRGGEFFWTIATQIEELKGKMAMVMAGEKIKVEEDHDYNADRRKETRKNKDLGIKDHINIDQKVAKKLYQAVSASDVAWLSDKIDEVTFINRLTLPPSEEKIKFHQLCQIYYVTKNVLFPPAEGKTRGRMESKNWDLIRQLFDAEDGRMNRVNRASKTPKNHENFNKHMGIARRIAKT